MNPHPEYYETYLHFKHFYIFNLDQVLSQKTLVMSVLVEFLSLSNPLELCLDYFSGLSCQPGAISKDTNV